MKHKLRSIIGPLLWISSFQYYVAQVLVASYWPSGHSYNWLHNTISALGNTACGQRGSDYICSPAHPIMNLSFFILGVTTIFGALIFNKMFAENIVQKIGFYMMALAGTGTLLVALFPENSVSSFHILGAGLAFIFGNLCLLVFGASLNELSKRMRYLSFGLGIVGLAAMGLFMAGIFGGLGIGGMERVVAYPQSIWMIAFGFYILFREAHHEKS